VQQDFCCIMNAIPYRYSLLISAKACSCAAYSEVCAISASPAVANESKASSSEIGVVLHGSGVTALTESSGSEVRAVTNAGCEDTQEYSAIRALEVPEKSDKYTGTLCATAIVDGSRARDALLHAVSIRGSSTRQSPNETMDEIIATTTNSGENHESAPALNEMLPTPNTLAHAPVDQLSSPVSISGTTFHTDYGVAMPGFAQTIDRMPLH
jgi:hypothetical protein